MQVGDIEFEALFLSIRLCTKHFTRIRSSKSLLYCNCYPLSFTAEETGAAEVTSLAQGYTFPAGIAWIYTPGLPDPKPLLSTATLNYSTSQAVPYARPCPALTLLGASLTCCCCFQPWCSVPHVSGLLNIGTY